MHTADKLDILAGEARYDLACACGPTESRKRGRDGRWIYPAALPDGRKVQLLKVLLSNSCVRDCTYCAQRRGRDFARSSFSPEELAATFIELYRGGRVSGLFLSSAIDGGVHDCMRKMLKTLEIVRHKHGYRGWLHCKILPGASKDHVLQAARLSTRLSLNLEAATPRGLAAISPQKDFQRDILDRMGWIKELVSSRSVRCRGQTTQFVVGAGSDNDAEIIGAAGSLYDDMGLARIYYSAFQPVPDTPLAEQPPASFEREHRLYQADFLLRKYGFKAGELVLDERGNLPLEQDPKTLWAMGHPECFPVEINTAARDLLLRVPGIGPIIADRIMLERDKARLRSHADLDRLGAVAAKAAPFILLDGHRADRAPGSQMALW
jgi:predicted DNA-binding helix-hairpin-helix protein